MMQYKLSFAIPAYNSQEFIKEAVESAIAQNLFSYEIVIVNDGSRDNTAKICHWLMKKYSHIPITYVENAVNTGACASHNQCVNLAKGEYIYNLDADNIVPKNLLNSLLNFANDHYRRTKKHAMISPEYAQYFKDNIYSFFGIRIPVKRRVIMHRLRFDKLKFNYILTHGRTPASGGNYLYHKSIFEEAGGYPEEDIGAYDNWGFGIRCYLAGFNYLTVPNTFYFHRLHPESYWVIMCKNGLQKEKLYKMMLLYKKYYTKKTVIELDPLNPNYPPDPLKVIKLRKFIQHKK